MDQSLVEVIANGIVVGLVIGILITPFVLFFLWRDAKKLGRNPWKWVLLDLLLGHFIAIIYVLTREKAKRAKAISDAAV